VLLDATDLRFEYASGRRRARRAASSPGAHRFVIDGVSVRIPEGSRLGILGPNGSGKTTLLKLLSGGLVPDTGTVRLNGVDVSAIPRRVIAQRLATVPQETHLAFDYTALEIVLMGRYPRLGAFEIEGPDDLAAAHAALAATGTRALADRGFMTLSGGEKQRVVIASALAQLDEARRRDARSTFSPAPAGLLFLDEPTASLDLRYQLEIASLVRTLNEERGVTVVLSTHDLRFARSVATTILLLANGRVLAMGPPADVLTPALIGELYEIDAVLAGPVLT
jgi:iron complex transport system ATP-binding protein